MLDEKAARRNFFLARIRRGPAGGSDYEALMDMERSPLPDGFAAIFSGTPYAVVGGVATRLYQPERFTKGIDVLVARRDLDHVRHRLGAAGGVRSRELVLWQTRLGLEGEVWVLPTLGEIDVLSSDSGWIEAALRSTNRDAQGIAVIALPYLVAMKLDASRSVDQGDLTRMLGFSNDAALEGVRRVVAELLPGVEDDLESYIVIGRLEIGEARRKHLGED